MYRIVGISVASAIFCIIVGEQCFQKSFELNTRLLEEHNIGWFNNSQHISCARLCLSITACKSMAFHPATNTCILYDVDASLGCIENATGYLYSDIGTWSPELAGGCGLHNCDYNQICYPAGQHFVCRDIDCGTPSPIEYGIVNVTSTCFGSTLNVTCESDYILEGSPFIRCYADRQWSAAPVCKSPVVECTDAVSVWKHYAVGFVTNLTLAEAVCPPGYGINSSTVVTCDLNGTLWIIGECIRVADERCFGNLCLNYHGSFRAMVFSEVDSVMGLNVMTAEACIGICNITTATRYVSVNFNTQQNQCQCLNCTMAEYLAAEYPYTFDVNFEFYEPL